MIDELIVALSTPWVTTGLQIAIGTVLVVLGVRAAGTKKRTRPSLPPRITPLRALGLGMTVTAVEASTALPYVGALAVIVRADPHPAVTVGILIAYNLVFVLPPIALALGARDLGPSRLRRATATIGSRWDRGPKVGESQALSVRSPAWS